ncbi:MAG: ORF6N domain-containing protein [Bacteroidetes bacterium]|nr:ORF6N domain-containing protein [Bacteroidota bacterium]
MHTPLIISEVQKKIISYKDQKVILDSDVALLYGVETKHVNQAVKNNIEKFPENYIIELNQEDWENLRSKILTANYSKTRVLPKAFTEKGLYMLATILKSKKATETTIAIVEAFAKLRSLTTTLSEINQSSDPKKQKQLMNRSGEMIADLLDDQLQISDTETTIELNFAVVKLKHTIKRK